ncbi:helix-turn-helix domain-containing protein [Granulicella pectinivorans]|uniref:helix-turn-helix transcriptional regulator n=1 Tax=Granulicella pectinivorans TaxID=474950 RepID=UPI000B7E3E92
MDNPTIEAPLTAEELSGILPLHPETIRKWAREGKIPCVRLSARRVVFLPSKIRTWLESRNGYTDNAGRTAPTEQEKAA